jgi:DNA ligase (NAD+)
VFSGVRDKTLENLIQSNGGSVTGSVSKNTTHLVVKDVNETSGKIKKAKELNITIISLEDLKEFLN